jgi:hypothetical protein
MVVSVKEYLDSMKKVSSSTKPANQGQNNLQTQLLLSQLIEAISYANSIDFRKKTLNTQTSGGQSAKDVVNTIKEQEKLVKQLADGQKLSDVQNKELTAAIDKFYEIAKAQEVNYKKFAANLEKFALQDLPEAVQNRLINDSRDAHMIGKEQKDKDGIIIPILKRMRNLLEDSAENTKQFSKRLFVSLDSFREGFLKGIEDLKDGFSKGGGFFDGLLDALMGLSIGGLVLQGLFKDGKFELGQILKHASKMFFSGAQKGIMKFAGNIFEGTIGLLGKGIGKLGFKGASTIGKGLGSIAKGGSKFLKKIPLLGTLISIWMGVERWKQKDYAGALIEFASGTAALFPGVGTAIAIALDLVNFAKDHGAFDALASKAEEKIPNLSENLKLSIPVVGPIMGIMKAVDLFKNGDKAAALKMVGKSFAALAIPGGAFLADMLSSLTGKENNIKPQQNSGGGGGFKWPWQRGGNELGDGDAGGGSSAGGSSGGSSSFGSNLAQAASSIGGGRTSSTGKCALKVGDAFSRVVGEKEASKYRGHAWQWISKLKGQGTKWFNNAGIAGSDKELRSVPAGSIAVWNKQSAHPYGHIEIADGKGNLISDFRRPANLGLYRKNPAGIKPLIFTPKGIPMPKLSGKLNNPKGQDETSTGGDVSGSDSSTDTPDTFEGILQAFQQFNQDIVAGVSGSATPSSGPTAPTMEEMNSGSPAATTAASISSNSGPQTPVPSTGGYQAPQQQMVQTTMQRSETPTMDTEIRDTDLALVNSILFQ